MLVFACGARDSGLAKFGLIPGGGGIDGRSLTIVLEAMAAIRLALTEAHRLLDNIQRGRRSESKDWHFATIARA